MFEYAYKQHNSTEEWYLPLKHLPGALATQYYLISRVVALAITVPAASKTKLDFFLSKGYHLAVGFLCLYVFAE